MGGEGRAAVVGEKWCESIRLSTIYFVPSAWLVSVRSAYRQEEGVLPGIAQ